MTEQMDSEIEILVKTIHAMKIPQKRWITTKGTLRKASFLYYITI